MGPSHSRILAVLLASIVLIGGANLAVYAANGKPLLLGKKNVESKRAVVKNTGKGPALDLKTRPGQPPLKVNRSKKVNKLNADLVDGTHAADLKSVAYRYELASSAANSSHVISFPGLPAGIYLMTYSIVSQNGGGVYCLTSTQRRALSYSSDIGSTYDTNTSSAVIDTSGGADSIECHGAPALQLYSASNDALSEVNFVRLDQVVEGTPNATRQGAKQGAGRSGGATGD